MLVLLSASTIASGGSSTRLETVPSILKTPTTTTTTQGMLYLNQARIFSTNSISMKFRQNPIEYNTSTSTSTGYYYKYLLKLINSSSNMRKISTLH